jgi:hypothetical protein
MNDSGDKDALRGSSVSGPYTVQSVSSHAGALGEQSRLMAMEAEPMAFESLVNEELPVVVFLPGWSI